MPTEPSNDLGLVGKSNRMSSTMFVKMVMSFRSTTSDPEISWSMWSKKNLAYCLVLGELSPCQPFGMPTTCTIVDTEFFLTTTALIVSFPWPFTEMKDEANGDQAQPLCFVKRFLGWKAKSTNVLAIPRTWTPTSSQTMSCIVWPKHCSATSKGIRFCNISVCSWFLGSMPNSTRISPYLCWSSLLTIWKICMRMAWILEVKSFMLP